MAVSNPSPPAGSPFETSATAKAGLERLRELWQRELLATRAAHRESRNTMTLAERVRRGNALQKLQLDEVEAKVGGRALLWFRVSQPKTLENLKLSGGDPVLLWQGHPDSERQERGILVRSASEQRIGVMVGSDFPAFLEEGPVDLDREAPETTFERGARALDRFLTKKELGRARELLFGTATPAFGPPPPELEFRDQGLNESQKEAVRFALSAEEVALIHGPPGTGKTRTLVEIVRQALQYDRSVLVTAASNTAVDNLVERMLDSGLKPLRLGHPARVSARVESRTLDVLIEQTEESARAKKWLSEARDLRRRYAKRKARGAAQKSMGGDLLGEAKRLTADARRAFDTARAKVLRRCKIVCTTCGGVDASLLGEVAFDMVVLDEATQAPDPMALAALGQGKIWVLAGDPQQLSPTVIDREAARDGLATTIFERLAKRCGAAATRMLTVQYRMHEGLIEFPSRSMYQGKLETAPSAQGRRLTDQAHVAADHEYDGPWLFLDTAGMGMSEERDADSASTSNPGHAERAAAEVRKLLARGVLHRDIAAITPYSAQVKLLRELLADEVASGVEVGTVDGFQGREKEAIVVDLVRSNESGELGFLNDIRRTNVAITRARSFLLIIADGSTLASHDYYRELVSAAESAGAWRSAWVTTP